MAWQPGCGQGKLHHEVGMPIAIMATMEVASELRDKLISSLKAHGARCLRNEPGTVQFEVLRPHDDDTKVFLFEVYRYDAAFEEHQKSPSIGQFRNEIAGMEVKLHVTRCAVL
jgi:(4S)-4-hydroxy-5-phosphonooxypentane-2,3-dione isomerase